LAALIAPYALFYYVKQPLRGATKAGLVLLCRTRGAYANSSLARASKAYLLLDIIKQEQEQQSIALLEL